MGQVHKSELTFEDLRIQYGTGKSYVVSGSGRNRVFGYRVGYKCKAGDLEEAEWVSLVRDLIGRSGEQELHQQLVKYIKDNEPWIRTKANLEREALKLHASRIFDNPLWVGFVAFNEAYRPDVLDSVQLCLVMTDCCKKAGRVTQERLELDAKKYGSAVCCPICGRWSAYALVG